MSESGPSHTELDSAFEAATIRHRDHEPRTARPRDTEEAAAATPERADDALTEAAYPTEKVEGYKAEFEQAVLAGIAAGEIPLTPEYVRRRLAETPIFFFGDKKGESNAAGYYSQKHGVGLYSRLTDKHMRCAMYHEFFHVLAGRTVKPYIRQGRRTSTQRHMRGGLRFSTPDTRESDPFMWLDEAVTERLSMDYGDYKNYKHAGIYPTELAMLDLLQRGGKHVIELQTFIDAYFETYDPRKPPADRLRAWKRLQSEINESFGTGFMNYVDRTYRSQGKQQAMIAVAWESYANNACYRDGLLSRWGRKLVAADSALDTVSRSVRSEVRRKVRDGQRNEWWRKPPRGNHADLAVRSEVRRRVRDGQWNEWWHQAYADLGIAKNATPDEIKRIIEPCWCGSRKSYGMYHDLPDSFRNGGRTQD